MRIGHIVNVYDSDNPDTILTQHVTLQSLLDARKNLKHPIDIKILTCKHVSDYFSVPSGIEFTEPLTRYAHELYTELPNTKKLPFLRDILGRGVSAHELDYYIYSNVDIGAYPNFYNVIFNLIDEGYDGACINRTTLPDQIDGDSVTTVNYKNLLSEPGKKHGGADCFLFSSYGRYCLSKLGNIFVGYPPIGAIMLEWVRQISKNFVWLKEKGNTFHLGDDREWKKPNDYEPVNKAEGLKLYPNYNSIWKRF